MNLRRNTFIAFVALLALLPQLPVPEFWITQANYIGLYSLVAIGDKRSHSPQRRGERRGMRRREEHLHCSSLRNSAYSAPLR